MACINGNKVNKIPDFNLLHDIINPPTCTETLNSRWCPIIKVCMNTLKGEARFNKF